MTDKGKVALFAEEQGINYVEVEHRLSAYLEFFRTNGKISNETPDVVQFRPDNLGSLHYIYADDVLVGFCKDVPVNDVYPIWPRSRSSPIGQYYRNALKEVDEKVDKNQLFYETYLLAPDRDSPVSTVTGLGVVTFRVINNELLEGIKNIADVDEIEGEFSYIRNTNLHYTPQWNFGVVSGGLLTFRAGKAGEPSRITQFAVKFEVVRHVMVVIPFADHMLEAHVPFGNSSSHSRGLKILTNTIAYSFK